MFVISVSVGVATCRLKIAVSSDVPYKYYDLIYFSPALAVSALPFVEKSKWNWISKHRYPLNTLCINKLNLQKRIY